MSKSVTLLFALMLVVIAACGGVEISPDTPPQIVYGEDVCAQCNMIISDERFAAGLVLELEPEVYEHRIFDDIGGLLAFEKEHAEELTIVAYHVHDYNSKEWIDGQTAYYIFSEDLQSPMGFGLAALAQQAEAAVLAQSWNGDVLSFAELHARYVATEITSSHVHDGN